MRLSVIPSLKYSAFGSPPAFTNGKTATESIVSPADGTRRTSPRPPTPLPTMTAAMASTDFLRHHGLLPALPCVSF